MRPVTPARHVLFAVAFGLATAFPASAQAGPYEDGLAAYESGDYATALRLWRPLAEEGDASAQVRLGGIYQDGEGVPQDYVEAARWYDKATEQGDEFAKISLEQVLRILTEMGLDAIGSKDFASALRLLEPAAELGDAEAQYVLGIMYDSGEGVPQDYVQAHMWLNLAASQIPASDKENRDAAVKNRDIVAKRMTPAEIAEAQKLAREWKPK